MIFLQTHTLIRSLLFALVLAICIFAFNLVPGKARVTDGRAMSQPAGQALTSPQPGKTNGSPKSEAGFKLFSSWSSTGFPSFWERLFGTMGLPPAAVPTAGIMFVQKASNTATSATTVTATFSAMPTTGNMIIAIMGTRDDNDDINLPIGFIL